MRLCAVQTLSSIGPVQRQPRHHPRQQPNAQQELVLIVGLQQRGSHPEQCGQDRELVVLQQRSGELAQKER